VPNLERKTVKRIFYITYFKCYKSDKSVVSRWPSMSLIYIKYIKYFDFDKMEVFFSLLKICIELATWIFWNYCSICRNYYYVDLN